MFKKRNFILPILMFAFVGLAQAAGYDVNVTTGMTLAKGPLAIHGYDPVAFHTLGAAMRGSHKYSSNQNGAVYRFVSESHKRLFEKDPARYLPQFGGFCAYGVALGKKLDGDPHTFRVVDEKLYFNVNPEILQTWLKDVPGNIRKAEKNWPRIKGTPPSELP